MTDPLQLRIAAVDRSSRRPGDCMSASLSVVTGIPYGLIPFPDLVEWETRDAVALGIVGPSASDRRVIVAFRRALPRWAAHYARQLQRAGLDVSLRFHAGPPPDSRVVAALLSSSSFNRAGHAVVMERGEIVYDPGRFPAEATRRWPLLGWFETRSGGCSRAIFGG